MIELNRVEALDLIQSLLQQLAKSDCQTIRVAGVFKRDAKISKKTSSKKNSTCDLLAFKKPMLQVVVEDAELMKFEKFPDMNTMLVCMADCAIRERMAYIHQLKDAHSMLLAEEKNVRDFCRFIALCLHPNSVAVQSSFETRVNGLFNVGTN